MTKLREDLLLKLERERSDEVAGLRSKQKQVGAQGPAGARTPNTKGLSLRFKSIAHTHNLIWQA